MVVPIQGSVFSIWGRSLWVTKRKPRLDLVEQLEIRSSHAQLDHQMRREVTVQLQVAEI